LQFFFKTPAIVSCFETMARYTSVRITANGSGRTTVGNLGTGRRAAAGQGENSRGAKAWRGIARLGRALFEEAEEAQNARVMERLRQWSGTGPRGAGARSTLLIALALSSAAGLAGAFLIGGWDAWVL